MSMLLQPAQDYLCCLRRESSAVLGGGCGQAMEAIPVMHCLAQRRKGMSD